MKSRARVARSLLSLLPALALLNACNASPVASDRIVQAPALPASQVEPDAGLADLRNAPCVAAVTSEALPARAATMTQDKLGTNEGVHVSQLFTMFKTNCGDCHVKPASLGQFSLTLADFTNAQDEFLAGKINKTIMLIRASDPDKVMPKNGPLLKDRPADHPLRKFAELLEQWLAQGRPVTLFPAGSAKSSSVAGGNYRPTREVGTKLTNIGNCVPLGRSQGLDMEAPEMKTAKELDEKFASMRTFADLPKSLRETDLTTLDSSELTKQRIFGYAPAYTLWADNAKKIRMVRVPLGESIKFDKATQSFDIPDNTRFYKTFLKKVKDLEGGEGYRKVETRIIIARRASDLDGKLVQNAVFGTYQWNEDESEASLVDTPYRDDDGFQDRVVQLVVDEKRDDEILRTKPKDPLAARLAGTVGIPAGAAPKPSMRTYAIPGFDRCMQCHMGAPGLNFALGFTPLQIRRRPLGEGGTFEPSGRDELNQLERLINYGLITGIGSPDEIEGLEDSQGDRKPRNDHELNAQGYMLGNCSHCHNPNGFPSQKEQVMKEDLNFLPSEEGGVFQFPLERYSRRTFRGAAQDIRMPYITPSLYDFTPGQLRYGVKELWREGEASATVVSAPPGKWIMPLPSLTPEGQEDVTSGWYSVPVSYAQDERTSITTPLAGIYLQKPFTSARPLLAPWRSLVYRNVDAPFSYQESGTIFPHMPMHTSGYDCRARRLLGQWMTSIPARWKSADKPSPLKRRLPSDVSYVSVPLIAGAPIDEGLQDLEEQPYEEVFADDPSYRHAQFAALDRLTRFRREERFSDCPDPNLDILDPEVATTGNGLPQPVEVQVKDDEGRETGERYKVLAPARPHYFQTDLRLSKRWVLRRGDWYQSLVDGNDVYATGPEQAEGFARLRSVLAEVKFDDALRSFATKPMPFGLWDEKNPSKSMCEAEFDKRGIPRLSSFVQGERPRWMANVSATQPSAPDYAPDARVFMTSPGEHVFDLICSKCHGSRGDGDSALASTMADLTGGLTRVANLRDGIFGPVMTPGSNRAIPKLGFGAIQDPAERESWAARYVAWMGLGGTRAYIPEAVVGSLRRFIIMGELSTLQTQFDPLNSADAGNMLKVAKDLCGVFLGQGSRLVPFDLDSGQFSTRVGSGGLLEQAEEERTQFYSLDQNGLVVRNGHAEIWEKICTYQNPLPVRVLRYYGRDLISPRDVFGVTGVYARTAYPADAPIGDEKGRIVSQLGAENQAPWCVQRPFTDRRKMQLEGKALPYCPEEIVDSTSERYVEWTFEDSDRWLLRAATNAGIAVFAFFDDMNRRISRGQLSPRNAPYDRCQDFAAIK